MSHCVFKAGAATAEILFPQDIFPIPPSENFVGVHDAPLAHVLIFGKETLYALAAFDLCDLCDKKGIRKALSETLGIPGEQVIIHSTHTLSSPHLRRKEEEKTPGLKERNDRMCACIVDGARRAAEKAKGTVREAKVGYGVGCTSISISRMAETSKGWWQASNDAGETDPSMPVIRIDDTEGNIIAILYDVNCAPSTLQLCFLSEGGRLVSGDIASKTSRILEKAFDCTAIYLCGAEADTWQILRAQHIVVDKNGDLQETDLHENGYLIVDLLSDRLAQQVTQAVLAITCKPLQGAIRMLERKVTVPGKTPQFGDKEGPVKYMEFYDAPDVDVNAAVVQLGDDTAAYLLGVEVTVGFAKYIREHSPYKNTFVAAFAVDGFGYLMEREWYEKYTYQCRKGGYAPGSAEFVQAEILDMLEELKKG